MLIGSSSSGRNVPFPSWPLGFNPQIHKSPFESSAEPWLDPNEISSIVFPWIAIFCKFVIFVGDYPDISKLFVRVSLHNQKSPLESIAPAKLLPKAISLIVVPFQILVLYLLE